MWQGLEKKKKLTHTDTARWFCQESNQILTKTTDLSVGIKQLLCVEFVARFLNLNLSLFSGVFVNKIYLGLVI